MPNGYALISVGSIDYLVSLQAWIFGVKYMYSAYQFSQTLTYFTLNNIQCKGWSGGLSYSASMIVCWCLTMSTFPGYLSWTKL